MGLIVYGEEVGRKYVTFSFNFSNILDLFFRGDRYKHGSIHFSCPKVTPCPQCIVSSLSFINYLHP